jgi:hypothetical protein
MKASIPFVLIFSALSADAFQPRSKALPAQTIPISSSRPSVPSTPLTVSKVLASSSPLFASTATDDAEWTKKRLHNTSAFRSLALLGAGALAGWSSPRLLSAQGSAALHILSFATWFGSVAYTTFIAGITMFKNLPRKVFGKLQAKLFPKYFTLGSVTLLIQLATVQSMPALKVASTKALSLALLMTLANQYYLEPKSTNNMMRRYELESEDGGKDTDEYKTLKADFGKFHGMSSLTNLLALCAGVAHAVYLAGELVV